MNSILFMASDFIDKMSNPSYGLYVNEEYALQYAKFLSQEGAEERLASEIERLSDSSSLTGYGWLWVLGNARSKEIKVDEDLLLDLMQRWQDVFIQTSIIKIAIKQSQNYNHRVDLEDTWFSRLIRLCTMLPEINQQSETDDRREFDPKEIDTSLAEHVLVAFLQVGHELSIKAALQLLNTDWLGQQKLRTFFQLRLELLDEETRRIWLENLDFPYYG